MTTHNGPILAQRDNLTCIQCEACGYAHLTQFPTEAELAEYYKSDFWQTTKVGALAEFERAREWWKAVHGDWLSIVEQHVGYRQTILDVGCGYGFFLETASDRGWICPYGIEPNNEAREWANKEFRYKNVQVVGGNWQDYHVTPYGCIAAHWLIEHLADPLEFLFWARQRLTVGGVLLTVIPQEWTEAQAQANEIVKKKAWHLDATHLNYFSQASFVNLLGRAGFRVVDMLASFQMERYITEFGTNYVDNPYLGSLAHRAVEQIELAQTREVRIAEARERAKYGRGRDLVVIARKD